MNVSDFYVSDGNLAAHAETPQFRIGISDGHAVVEMLVDLATEQQARDLVEPFLNAYEMKAGILRGYPMFDFQFSGSRIETSEGIVVASLVVTSTAAVAFQLDELPDLPEFQAQTAWSGFVWEQFKRFRRGHQTLVPTAFMCLTLARAAGSDILSRRATDAEVARLYGVDPQVLSDLGRLTAVADPVNGRTVGHGSEQSLTTAELAWIEAALVELVGAMVTHDLMAD